MMSQRELSILAKARISLNDVDEEPKRWSTARLMQLLSEGQDSLCADVPVHVLTATLQSTLTDVVLPEDCLSILNISANSEFIPIVSYDDIERIDKTWPSRTGDKITSILVDPIDQTSIRPYPICDGITLDYRYQARPPSLGWDPIAEDAETPLVIKSRWDEALKQYVIGMAFLDYGDEFSGSRAQTALELFSTIKTKALNVALNAYTQGIKTHEDYATSREMKIINNARVSLSDVTDNPKWSDQRLMQLLSEGQSTLCEGAPVYIQTGTLVSTLTDVVLPEDCLAILNISANDEFVPLVSYDDIERIDKNWPSRTGDKLTSILVDPIDQTVIRPYPICDGITLDYRYQARPTDLGWDTATNDALTPLVVKTRWDEALKQYVVGMAFLDYGDGELALIRSKTALELFNLTKSQAAGVALNAYTQGIKTHEDYSTSREMKIINNARVSLSDVTDNPKWSDQRLMQLLSEGQSTLCESAPVYVKDGTLQSTTTVSKLPDDCLAILNMSAADEFVPLVSYTDIERIDKNWLARKGTKITSVLVDPIDQTHIRPYPLCADVTLDFRYQGISAPLGWDAAANDAEIPLVVKSRWDEALKQYIVGMAFLDYGGELSLLRSKTALELFNAAKSKALGTALSAYTKGIKTHVDYTSTRELQIINEARLALSDVKDTPQWSDRRLMQLLNEAQNDMCRNIPLIIEEISLTTSGGQAEYMLPVNSLKLLTAFSERNKLTLTSYDRIEETTLDWADDYGSEFTAIIVNALSQQKIRPYPLVSESRTINLRYQAMPTQLGWDDDSSANLMELSISAIWDEALKQYVIAKAFLDLGDGPSLIKGSAAEALYTKEFVRAENLARKAFSKRLITTGYQAKVVNTNTRNNYGSSGSGFKYI